MLAAHDLEVTPPGARAPAVRGLSLAVAPGEWVVLAGPNGGGKTTALLALAGLWPASAGTIELDGARFGPDTRARAAGDIAVVLQDPSSQLLQPSVGEELAFSARNLGRSEPEVAAAVRHWSAALGLERELPRDPMTLSAGRQQLVLLAAALVAAPRLLLADEPTAHLDAEARARVRRMIAGEVARGLAVIWVTQDADEVALATRTIAVGGESVRASRPARPAPPSMVECVLSVRVAPDPGGDGARIHSSSPLDLQIGARGVTAVLAPNGAGKTVLLAAIAGLDPSDQVGVAWDRPPSQPPIVALQYPELQIFEENVEDEVTFAATARGMDRSQAIAVASEALKSLGVEPAGFLARRTWTLSTGEKRVLEVIAALIAPASLILLDEPTAGLDPKIRSRLGELVIRRGDAVPILVATQDRDWAEGVGARILTLGR